MNIRYMVSKERYNFIYLANSSFHNGEGNFNFSNEIPLLLKQFSLYGVSLKTLARNRPSINIKNELLNIAYLCMGDDILIHEMKKDRALPIRLICSMTKKSSNFIVKWGAYINAYIILLSNNIYSDVKDFLSIYNNSSNINSKVQNINSVSYDVYASKSQTGIVLKTTGRGLYILTPYGDFLKLKSNNRPMEVGEIITSEIKKELVIPKFPFILSFLGLLVILLICTLLYMQPKRTLIIDSTFSITLKLNNWNKTIGVQSLGKKAIPIVESIKLFSHSLDDSIYIILKTANNSNLITKNSKISIYITGKKDTTLELPKTEIFIHDNNLNVFINNNGVEHIMKKFD